MNPDQTKTYVSSDRVDRFRYNRRYGLWQRTRYDGGRTGYGFFNDYERDYGPLTVDPAEPNEVPPRADVLREAEGLITGDRNKAYGSPTQNFTNTAEIWTTLLRHKLKDGEGIEPAEVGTLMIALKLARTVGQPKRDNYVDMAGYAGCAYEADVESGRIES